MNFSDLKNFFESQTNAATLKLSIQDEAADYKYSVQAKKQPVVIIDGGNEEYFILNGAHFEQLCRAYLTGTIDQYELFYIGDAIQLSDNFDFENRKTASLFAHISNISVNGPINQKIVAGLVESLA